MRAHDFAEAFMDYAEEMTPGLRPTATSALIARMWQGRGPSRLMFRRSVVRSWAEGSHPALAELLERDDLSEYVDQCDAAVYLLGSGSPVVTTPRWLAIQHGLIKVRVGPEKNTGRLVHLTACTSRTLDFLA